MDVNSGTRIRLTARTDVGKVRDHNEDNYVVCPNLEKEDWFLTNDTINLSNKGSLLVIADGMGGLNAGEIASGIAVSAIQNFYTNNRQQPFTDQRNITENFQECIKDAHLKMIKHANEYPETKGMGTTLVMALIKDAVLHTAWVGDSRCYVFRSQSDLYFATKDHSYVQELVDAGKITYEQAFFHPESNVITRSLGDNNGKLTKSDSGSFPLEVGDRILMCSDGLNGMLQDAQIATILREYSDINDCAKELIEQANQAGGHDNITVVLYDIVSLDRNRNEEQMKLYQLQFAAKYQEPGERTKPFATLKPGSEVKSDPISENITSKNKGKRNILIIGLLVTFIAFAALWYFIYFEKRKSGKDGHEMKGVDSLNSKRDSNKYNNRAKKNDSLLDNKNENSKKNEDRSTTNHNESNKKSNQNDLLKGVENNAKSNEKSQNSSIVSKLTLIKPKEDSVKTSNKNIKPITKSEASTISSKLTPIKQKADSLKPSKKND